MGSKMMKTVAAKIALSKKAVRVPGSYMKSMIQSFIFLHRQYTPMFQFHNTSAGTSAKNAIPTFGGFNFSEFNTQKHTHPRTEHSTFSEQERTHKQFSGRDPLNPKWSTTESNQKMYSGLNKAYGWREPTLALPVPAQVETLTSEVTASRKQTFGGSDKSLLARATRHGFGQNDPALQHLLDERGIAPQSSAALEWTSDPFVHSDVGVPSAVNQNLVDNPTKARFPFSMKEHYRGKHDHLNLKHERTPAMRNESHSASGTHHTHAAPTNPVTNGFRATRGPLERPLLLSDLPAVETPQIRPDEWPGLIEPTQNRAVFLQAY
jgi:hypothetical protein